MSTIPAADQPAVRARPRAIAVAGGLLGAVIAGLLVAALLIALIATQVLGFHALAIASGSMVPALNQGDLVVTRPVPISQIRQGDVVAFDEGEITHLTVVHRVAGIVNVTINTTDSKTGAKSTRTDRLLLTKGDANRGADGTPVSSERYKGLVFVTVPAVGGILGAGIVQQLLLGLAIITAVAWLAYEIVRFRRRGRTAA